MPTERPERFIQPADGVEIIKRDPAPLPKSVPTKRPERFFQPDDGIEIIKAPKE